MPCRATAQRWIASTEKQLPERRDVCMAVVHCHAVDFLPIVRMVVCYHRDALNKAINCRLLCDAAEWYQESFGWRGTQPAWGERVSGHICGGRSVCTPCTPSGRNSNGHDGLGGPEATRVVCSWEAGGEHARRRTMRSSTTRSELGRAHVVLVACAFTNEST